ncbi:hypothetical protein [Haloferula sp. BvORR071]|uniref:hypothetical protein n=1 Tax=Haloferula sp. BvORR071 TaxID=1396141 RepID=UPI0005539BF9|nr:hypothetical protein [Haloferula sp. BvORR071]
MKPPSIKSWLLLSALLTPLLQAQDAPAKIREIEQKVLSEQYQEGVQAVIGSAREVADGTGPELLDKRMQWLAVVGGQIGAEERIAVANREDMTQSAGTINDLAWNMITSADTSKRRPDIALRLANIAIELGGEDADLKPRVLDTKARALFLLGKRDEAIAEQEKSVASATEQERPGFEATLAAYRRAEPPEGATLAVPAVEAASASKDPGPKLDDILALQKRVETAERERSSSLPPEAVQARADLIREQLARMFAILESAERKSSANTPGGIIQSPIDIARARADLRKQMDELERFAGPKEATNQGGLSAGTSYILEKLRNIVIPSIQFDDTSLDEAVDFLRKKSIELDTSEPDPARKGLNFVVRLPAGKPAAAAGNEAPKPETPRIKELRLRNVPLAEALRYVCDSTRFRYKVDDFAVTLVSLDAPEDLFNRTFTVPPNFGSSLVPIQDLLKLCGVKFGEGASAVLTSSGMLVVRNTPNELDKIEMLIEAEINGRGRGRAAVRQDTAPATPVER